MARTVLQLTVTLGEFTVHLQAVVGPEQPRVVQVVVDDSLTGPGQPVELSGAAEEARDVPPPAAAAADPRPPAAEEVPGEVLALARRLSAAGEWTPERRIRRAYRLGVSDRVAADAAADGRRVLQEAYVSPIRGQPAAYVVLRSRAGERVWTRDRAVYARLVLRGNPQSTLGEAFIDGTVSRALLTLAEAQAYVRGAGLAGLPEERRAR